MWSGVIFAHTAKLGNDLKRSLGLKYWYVATPHTLLDGRSQRVQCEPRLIAVNHSEHDPMPDLIIQYSLYLVRLCGDRTPEVWHIRKAGS